MKMFLDSSEQSLGQIQSHTVIGTKNVMSFKMPLPNEHSLTILPAVGISPPPTPADHDFLFVGDALILGTMQKRAFFRRTR